MNHSVDSARLLRAGVLAVWAALFFWLWLSGKGATYVGPRTSWVVPFGAIGLLGCAAALALTARGGSGRLTTAREGLGHAAMIAPVLAVLLVPSPKLGALAASRKSGAPSIDRSAVKKAAATPDAPLGLLELVSASADPGIAGQLDVQPGRAAFVDGLVTKSSATSIEVTRFRIYCCAADAIPYSMTVALPAGQAAVKRGTWVKASGSVITDPQDPQGFAIAGQQVFAAEIPNNPYV